MDAEFFLSSLLLFCLFRFYVIVNREQVYNPGWKSTHRTASTMARATAAVHRPRTRPPGARGPATIIFCRPLSPIPPTHHLRTMWVCEVPINSRFLLMFSCQKKHQHNLKIQIILQYLGYCKKYFFLYIFFPFRSIDYKWIFSSWVRGFFFFLMEWKNLRNHCEYASL